MMGFLKLTSLGVLAGLAVGLVGCGSATDSITAPAALAMPKDITENPQLSAEAGVPIPEAADPAFAETRKIAEERPFAVRGDAFALLGPEKVFDRQQRAELLFGKLSGFSVEWEPPVEKPDPEEEREPQPYRRLAGILLGDAVMALIEMEDGQTYQVRPGQQIPNSEWSVFSIDSEKAILRRKGNKLPKEIAVPLESRRSGGGGGGAPAGGGLAGGGGAQNPGEGMTPGVGGASGTGAGAPAQGRPD